MKSSKRLSKKLNQRFAEKQDELDRRPAVMGDGAGNLYVTGFDNFVYVTMGDKAVPVFNNRVPPQTGLQVWVGYAAEEPTLFQVLSTRSESPAGTQTGFVGYAPARRYEWMARNGGQDPLSVHLRAFTPLKLSVSPDGWMFVDLYRGFIYSGSAYIAVPRQNVDLYTQIPTTAGKAAFVLITINTSGTVVQTKGSEVDIDVLAITDIPAIPAGTSFICGAVRVYYGQLEIQEGRTNTDFVDLRFPGYAGGGLWQPLDAQLTDIAGLTPTDNGVIIGNGTNFVIESGSTLRTSLGLAIGSDVQAYDADLAAIAALTPTDDDIIQRKAGAWVNRTIAQLVTDLQTVTDTLYIAKSLLTTRGDIITRSATIPQRLALGAAGSFLRSDGTDVVWSTGLIAITASKTLTVANSLTLSGTDGESLVLTKGLTVTTNAGTIAFGAAAITLTVPESMVSAGRNVANTYTEAQTISNTTDSSNYATGALIVSGGVGIAKSVSINGNVGIKQAASAAAALFILPTVTDTSGGVFGINGGVFSNPASASSTTIIGAQMTARTNVANAQNHTGLIIGGLFTAYHRGSGTSSSIIGGRFSVQNDGGGTTTDAIGISILSGTNSSGTITNNYGLQINNQTAGGTLNYAIYTGTGLVRFGDDVSSTGSFLSSHATKGIGYATGAGGTVTQATNKATGVTLNKVTGLITMNNAALAADTTVSFTITSSAIAATDTIILQHNSAGTVGAYTFGAQPAAGSAVINVRNVTAGSLSEAIVIRYTVIKSISA